MSDIEQSPFVKGDDGKDYIRLYYFMPAKHLYSVLAEDRMKVSVPERCNDPLEFLPTKDANNHTPERAEGGFISFSACVDNSLMWAHYADSHHGVCLQFDFPVQTSDTLSNENSLFYEDEAPDEERKRYALIDLQGDEEEESKQYWYLGKFSENDKRGPFYATLVEVAYAAKRPKKKLGMGGAFFMNGQLVNLEISKVFFSKALEWKYEQEWRLMVTLGGCKEYRNGSFFVSGLTRYISAVILGARYPESLKMTWAVLCQAIKEKSHKLQEQKLQVPKIYRAEFDDEDYCMKQGQKDLPVIV